MADKLEIPLNTVRQRLKRAGIKPFCQEALYTDEDFERIKTAPMGRPPKKQVAMEKAAPIGRPKKAAAPEPVKPAKKAKK